MEKSTFESTENFFDQWIKIYETTYGGLFKIPAIGPTREKQEKMMKSFPSYVNLYTAWIESNINYQIVLTEAMIKTYEKTINSTKGDLKPENCKEFYNIWIDTYSETFKEFLKTGHSASDMGKFMSSFIDFQKRNKEMFEENYLKPMNLPTKTDIDGINKELYTLRKTVGDMKIRFKELSGKTDESEKDMEILLKDLSEKLDKSEKDLSEKLYKYEKDLSEKLDKSEKDLSEKLDRSEKDLSEKLDKSEKDLSEKLDKSEINKAEKLDKSEINKAEINRPKKEINKTEINRPKKEINKTETDETR